MTPTLSTNDDVNLRVSLLLPREQPKALFACGSVAEQDCLPLSLLPALLPVPRKHQHLVLVALASCPSWTVVECLTAVEQSATFSGDTMDISMPGDLDENCTENKVYF